jgi:hypothetical protein
MNYHHQMGAAAPGVNNPMLPQMNTQDQGPLVAVDWYTYSAQVTGLTALTSQVTNIQIEADSDFDIIKLTSFGIVTLDTDVNEATRTLPMVTVLLTDTGSGRNLMNIPLAIPSMFGTAELPFILPVPKRLFARATLAITLQNISTDIDYAYLQVSFTGKKIFSRT